MRRRTSTWDPHLREYPGSPLPSPHLRDSLLPSTPNGIRQRLFVRHDNSPASLSDNWRQSNSGLTVDEMSPTSLTLPSMEVKLSPAVVDGHERKPLSETPFSVISTPPMIAMASQATVAVSNLVTPIQSADRLSFRATALGYSAMNVTENIKEAASKVAQASNSVDRDGRADRHPEEPSGTPCTLTDAKGAVRLPLQDITASTSVPRPKTIEYSLRPLTATETSLTPVTLKQTDASSKEVFKPVQVSEGDSRETTSPNSPNNQKPSADPNALCAAEVLRPSGTPTPHNRHPRARRSAPHLGKYTHNNNNNARQQVKAPRATQTPDGSKRRRTRTASAKGVENWNFNVSWATPTIDRSGQIILPAGMGWKGRTSVGAVVAGQPQPQRQRLPTGVIV
jgi:hypothetical protein